MNTIQFDLGGGASVALPAEQVAEKAAAAVVARLLSHAALFPLGDYVPDQGGYYIGARKAGGQVRHYFAPARDDHPTGVKFDDVGEAVRVAGPINGFNDWTPAGQEELMLAYINARELFPQSGSESIYWTSKPYGSNDAWALTFEDGDVYNWNRGNAFAVLPLRSITT